jgi:hypothetical protein
MICYTYLDLWDFKFSRWRVWCSELSSGMYCHVKWRSTIILHGSTSQKTIVNIPRSVQSFRLGVPVSVGSHGNITVFMSFFPCSKLHALAAIVTSTTDCMWCNHSNPKMQTIPNHCCARLKIMHATNNFEPQQF